MGNKVNPMPKKRGRPRLLHPELELTVRLMFPELTSRKAIQERGLAMSAMSRLKGVEGVTWLVDYNAIERGDDDWKPKLLAEVGRIEDTAAMIDAARELCRIKPSTVAGIQLLRNWRGVAKPSLHDRNKLGEAIASAVDAYRAKHRDCPWSDVIAELHALAGVVESMECTS